MKIGNFTGGTSVTLKNIFTNISRYPTGKHEIMLFIHFDPHIINTNLPAGLPDSLVYLAKILAYLMQNCGPIKTKKRTGCVCETLMPQKRPFIKKCNLDIQP